MKILVCGDRIFDHYQFCKATRLCPEGPAPVLVSQAEKTTEGGAALIAAQLKELLPIGSVVEAYGSVSNKTRIIADRTLIARIDQDRYSIADSSAYWTQIRIALPGVDAVVVGDYDKGAMVPSIASALTSLCLQKEIPLFVDAKRDVSMYKGCFAIFPNEDEHKTNLTLGDYRHIIRKLGPRGCTVDNVTVGTEEQQVFDVTGAGDIFLAVFVYSWLNNRDLIAAAHMANRAGGISVRHLGTYVVKADELL